MLTSYAEIDVLFAAIEAGTAGYVLKRASGQDAVRALQEMVNGQVESGGTEVRVTIPIPSP